MTRCLDCVYLTLHSKLKGGGKEISEVVREELRGTHKELHDTFAKTAGGENDPRFFDCSLGLSNFPGKNQLRSRSTGRAAFGLSKGPNYLHEMEQSLQALTQGWDCKDFIPHSPGVKPSEHLKIQSQHAWEEEQEQDRRAWEEKQVCNQRAWEESQQERQEKFESEQRQHDRRMGNRAIIISVLALLASIFIPLYLNWVQSQSITVIATPTSTPTLTLTPTHTATPTLMPTSTLTPTSTYTPTVPPP